MSKVFVGSGWESKYGVNISLKKDQIQALKTDKYGDVFLTVTKRKEKDDRSGATHYVSVDDWKYSNLKE